MVTLTRKRKQFEGSRFMGYLERNYQKGSKYGLLYLKNVKSEYFHLPTLVQFVIPPKQTTSFMLARKLQKIKLFTIFPIVEFCVRKKVHAKSFGTYSTKRSQEEQKVSSCLVF